MTPPGAWSLRGGRRLFYNEAASRGTGLRFRDNPRFVAHPFVLLLLLLFGFCRPNENSENRVELYEFGHFISSSIHRGGCL